jgi:hypothetical protein
MKRRGLFGLMVLIHAQLAVFLWACGGLHSRAKPLTLWPGSTKDRSSSSLAGHIPSDLGLPLVPTT